MTRDAPAAYWQDVGWNGLFLQLPPPWQPTAIYPAYLLFEQKGQPVFEIKWQKIQGRFSPERIFTRIRKSFPREVQLEGWDPPADFHSHLAAFNVAGFQLQHEKSRSHGLIIFCPVCNRATLMQWYTYRAAADKQLAHILSSFRDHSDGSSQLWTLYDIRTHLPAEAKLQSHEFLPGRYTLCFTLNDTAVTLYRFKPAAVLLQRQTIGEFGTSLINSVPLEEEYDQAFWCHKADGLELLLAKARRNPVFQWMRLWHEPRHNVILGVKAEGKHMPEPGSLDRLCESFISLDPL